MLASYYQRLDQRDEFDKLRLAGDKNFVFNIIPKLTLHGFHNIVEHQIHTVKCLRTSLDLALDLGALRDH
jgi:hypothetical protein